MYQQDGEMTDLKYSKKMKTGPFVYKTPLQEYINDLDEEMAKVLNSKIPTEDKMALYLNLLAKYKQKYDITKLNDNEIIISEVKASTENNTKLIINEIKNEIKKEIDEEKINNESLTEINNQLKEIKELNNTFIKQRKVVIDKKIKIKAEGNKDQIEQIKKEDSNKPIQTYKDPAKNLKRKFEEDNESNKKNKNDHADIEKMRFEVKEPSSLNKLAVSLGFLQTKPPLAGEGRNNSNKKIKTWVCDKYFE